MKKLVVRYILGALAAAGMSANAYSAALKPQNNAELSFTVTDQCVVSLTPTLDKDTFPLGSLTKGTKVMGVQLSAAGGCNAKDAYLKTPSDGIDSIATDRNGNHEIALAWSSPNSIQWGEDYASVPGAAIYYTTHHGINDGWAEEIGFHIKDAAQAKGGATYALAVEAGIYTP
ncbi:Dr family adhesin structural subunit [Escherichia coli]|uniref:Dr family adhesin structural subunit n=1 Tax=Escherichia coli TaxID=562 RepID=UPI0010E63ACA|nr:Dr family adhesin structural subunit [Escherichia coli]GDM24619.1 hypothetical protein BvCmsNSNP012_04907 [Escherichia coli]